MDVCTAIVLETDHSMQKILEDAGDLYSEPYHMTPLDFVNCDEWIHSKLWTYNVGHTAEAARRSPESQSAPCSALVLFQLPRDSEAEPPDHRSRGDGFLWNLDDCVEFRISDTHRETDVAYLHLTDNGTYDLRGHHRESGSFAFNTSQSKRRGNAS